MTASHDSDMDPFWVKSRAEFLAAESTSADPSACGTCRSNVAAGEPVEHDGCAQRATLLQAPDHPHYEILAGFSLEENEKLPPRFHVPVFDDLGQPNLWLCAVCWEEGQVVGWPCATAQKYGNQVFTPLHEAETAQKKQAAELAAYRALELGDPDGRVSASCDNPEHPTWLRAPDDTRGCPWCRIAELDQVRTEALAEAKDAVVEWLVKKAHEGTEVARLADKVERGAIRLFFDAELAAAAAEPQHYDKVPDPADGCHWCACGNRWPCKHATAVTS
ncbi:hypothetical protein ACWDBO_31140 [Streptomyces mirabilis]|uniref:hypothetical protein n=1 Tax=Streptomyces mirabilis TaxID=68239 RepID=UPI003320AF41